jgi:hypothetical protein
VLYVKGAGGEDHRIRSQKEREGGRDGEGGRGKRGREREGGREGEREGGGWREGGQITEGEGGRERFSTQKDAKQYLSDCFKSSTRTYSTKR